jgi:hypothetical protein
MKNKILALLATIGLVSSASAIEINDNLSINGFIDGSYRNVNSDSTAVGSDSEKIGLDEVELNFILNAGNVSGELHVDSENIGGSATTIGQSDDGVSIEQAHFTYTFENGISATFGRYGSKLGLEGEDPAGLWTFSRAYENAPNMGNIDNDDLRMDGIALSYSADAFTLGVSFDQNQGDDLDSAGENLNYEISLGYTGIENLDLNIGYRENSEEPSAGPINEDLDVLNINAAYTFGKGLLAAEWQQVDFADASREDVDAWQILVDYDFTNQFGGAVRYSNEDSDFTVGSTNETSKWTIAPNYAITESLGAILEYSSIERDGAANADTNEWALELTYTF